MVSCATLGSTEAKLCLILTPVVPFHRGKYAAEGRVETFQQLVRDSPYWSNCLKIFPDRKISELQHAPGRTQGWRWESFSGISGRDYVTTRFCVWGWKTIMMIDILNKGKTAINFECMPCVAFLRVWKELKTVVLSRLLWTSKNLLSQKSINNLVEN